MIKTNKTTFKAIVHVYSLDGNKLPLWNTHTNTFIDIDKTHHIIEVTAEDKHEVRRKISRMMPQLQHRQVPVTNFDDLNSSKPSRSLL